MTSQSQQHVEERGESLREKGWRKWLRPSIQAVKDFIADDALSQAAAVAFYTALSLVPLIVLVLMLSGMLLGESAQQRMLEEVQRLIGGPAAVGVEAIQEEGQRQAGEANFLTFGGIVGLLILIWSASGVFVQLQWAMNIIWDVKPDPHRSGLWAWIRKRLLSVGMIFAIVFLLLASMLVTAALNAIIGRGEADEGWLWLILNILVAVLVYWGLFLLIFKFLPDAHVPWKPALLGAAATAVLFTIGRELIGMYLGQAEVGEGYGGAGPLVALLIWVYYSAVILFVGAELTQAYAKAFGYPVTPEPHATVDGNSSKELPVSEE